MSLAFIDGKFVDKNELRISPFDFGFSRGVTVFEFTRLYGSVPFRLDDHIARFEEGAHKLGIACPFGRDEVRSAVLKIAGHNKYPHSGVKFYLTAGECKQPGPAGFGSFTGFTPHLLISEEEVQSLHPDAPKGIEAHTRGYNLKTVPFMRDIPDVKTTNYARGFFTIRNIVGEGWDEILYTHPDGYVTEVMISNFFCVIDGVLCTPKQGMLHGITRMHILQLAGQLSIPVAETDITPDKIGRATEAFISSSFIEMMPVKKIDSQVFPHTVEAPFYTRLRQAFTASLRSAA